MIVVDVLGMAIKGDLISEDIIMEDVKKAINRMNMPGIIAEATKRFPEEILLVPQFSEIGNGTQAVMPESDISQQKTKAMLVEIAINIPYAEELPYKVHQKVEAGFKNRINGLYTVHLRTNHEKLYKVIKPPQSV